MEGIDVMKDSYQTVEKLIKANTTGTISIDYSKLDSVTASTLRLAINKALLKRKGELWQTLSGAN
jgi:hypothetical protein